MATQPNTPLALKGFAVASTLWVGSAMASTSLIFIPALLRPLALASSTSSSASGRLTPQNENKGSASTPASSHRTIAQQFAQMDVLAFRAQVPLELLNVLAYGYLAYRSYSARSGLWVHWASCAGLMAAVFPFTGALMVPYVHKLAQLAGTEESVEPYEDAPLDREAEKSNTVDFLKRWNALNAVRTLSVLATGALGVRAWVLE